MKLSIENITKKYGTTVAVNAMNVTLSTGIIGLLGANGSGKTTLLRILVTVLPSDEGTVFYNDLDILKHQKEYLSQVGYLPQHIGMYPNFKVVEFLRYMGAIKGLSKDYTEQRITELLPLVHLQNERKKKIKTLSGGMKQRLGIAQALLNDPAILILDEPTSGLDPKERSQFSRVLASLSKDKIILLSTHIVSDIESIANEIMIMKKGSLIAHDSITNSVSILSGKVKEKTVSLKELNDISKNIILCSQKAVNENMQIRYIDMQNCVNGNIVEENLNDLYLYYFEEEAL